MLCLVYLNVPTQNEQTISSLLKVLGASLISSLIHNKRCPRPLHARLVTVTNSQPAEGADDSSECINCAHSFEFMLWKPAPAKILWKALAFLWRRIKAPTELMFSFSTGFLYRIISIVSFRSFLFEFCIFVVIAWRGCTTTAEMETIQSIVSGAARLGAWIIVRISIAFDFMRSIDWFDDGVVKLFSAPQIISCLCRWSSSSWAFFSILPAVLVAAGFFLEPKGAPAFACNGCFCNRENCTFFFSTFGIVAHRVKHLLGAFAQVPGFSSLDEYSEYLFIRIKKYGANENFHSVFPSAADDEWNSARGRGELE